MSSKYVIRYTAQYYGVRRRTREYFDTKRDAEQFARDKGLPKSQIKKL